MEERKIICLQQVSGDKSKNVIAVIIKGMAFITWIVGFILGWFAGSLDVSYSKYYGYSYQSNYSSFNFGCAFLAWLVFFIIGIGTYALGEIISLLQGISTSSYGGNIQNSVLQEPQQTGNEQ